MSGAAVRVIACDILARWEREARVNAAGLKATVEVDQIRLLQPGGLDLPDDATEGDRTIAMRAAWARVDEGRTRADALRLASVKLQEVLAELGGVPTYDHDAPPWTVRQELVEAHGADIVGGEREPVRLDKGAMVEAAERHGLMQEGGTNAS